MKISRFLEDNLSVTKGSVNVPIKSLVDGYRERYNKVISDPKNTFQYRIYQYGKDKSTIIHVKVPSETVKGFHYDVLFELFYGDGVNKIEDCDVKLFSNCPSYVYGFFYIHYHLDLNEENSENKRNNQRMLITNMTKSRKVPANRLVITGMEKKVGKEAWNDPPTTRNALGLPLWDKSLYFALFYLQRNVSFSEIRRARRTITERQLLDNILSFDRLMINRKQLESRQKAARANLRKDLEKKVRTTETKVRKNNTMKSAQSMKTMRSATNKSKSPSTYTRMKKS